jgi:hypothetical protein
MSRTKGRFHAGIQGILILLFLSLCIASVSAISVSGSKYIGSILPGGTDTHIMTVSIGSSEDPTDVNVEVFGFGQSMGQTYTPLDPANDVSAYSAQSFITLDNDSVHLEPGTGRVVNAKISIPENAGPGGRYALIYIHALPGKGKSFTTAVLIPVMITISGTTPTETGSITDLSVGNVTLGQPITVTTTLKNTGNYHYYHTVNTVAVRDVNGNLIGNYSTQPSVYAIIPENTVRYLATPELQNLPVGTYTADSQVLLESGTVLDEKTTTFTVKTNYVAPVTESNITLTPGSAGTLTSPDGRYSVSFPQGAVLGDVVVTLKPYSRDSLQSAPTGAKLGATSFEITGLTGLLSKDATVRVTYSADDLAAAGGDTSPLKLSYYDTAQGAWVILPTHVDAQGMTLTAATNHLSVWAVMVSPSTTGGTASESPSGATATQSPVSLTMILGSLILAVIAATNSVGKRK